MLQRDGASVLFDTGVVDGPIVRRLEEAGVERLDVLVLTHAEADHEGAALAVVRRFTPRLVIDGGAGWHSQVQSELPAAAASARSEVIAPEAGGGFSVAGIRFHVLWPPPLPPGTRPEGNPNDRAVVALASVGWFDVLLPADAESNVTARLDLPHVEALKVAHHGSEDPGLPALLERLRPQVAAIEVGAHNPYGHPTRSTLNALRAVPELVRTDRDGTVRLHVRADRMWLERSR